MNPVTKGQFGTKNTVLSFDNITDVLAQAETVAHADTIELNFPKFTDGRAYSQASLLRSRLGFKGDIRATGDVLLDQLLPMRRCGFSSAQLRADQDVNKVTRLLSQFEGFYQADPSGVAA